MLHALKKINFNSTRFHLFCSFVFAAVVALLPISAGAQCSNWDASGDLVINQEGYAPKHITLVLEQRGKVITGLASWGWRPRSEGKVHGLIDGDSFNLQILWQGNWTQVFDGKILSSGHIEGETSNKNATRDAWYGGRSAERPLKCAPTPKPISRSGKMPKPAPAPPTPPFITAGQAIVPTPNHPLGIVVMGWDGGPDHPNVEVFVSMDNSVEIPAFSTEHASQSPVWKQPKMAAIQLSLQRYHHYKFVLKAAGKTLSTAAFVVP